MATSTSANKAAANKKKNLPLKPKKIKPKKAVNKSTSKKSSSIDLPLPKAKLLEMHDLMVKSRVLEERLIKIYKTGEAYFWIGGPGEEAFGVPLGLLVNKGQGHDHDYLHLHYRATPTLIAMGMEMIDSIRLIMNRATDTSTGGRNFSNHYCYPKWNVTPITSPIETQYSTAIGTAWAQRRENAKGITIVTGGDAGSAEGDFASALIWSSRPEKELPMLITVQNNAWGISTSYSTQHGEVHVADRGKAFQMKTSVINGNDPIETYFALESAMEYIRRETKPFLLEAQLSRLYGHSSASGANPIDEPCCIRNFEDKLLKWELLTKNDIQEIWTRYEQEGKALQEKVRLEPAPTAESVWDHVYANGENADWRKF